MKPKGKRIIWVQKLGVGEILILLFRGVISTLEIRYDENQITSSGKRLLSNLNKINLCENFHYAELTFGVNDSNGYPLIYLADSDHKKIIDLFCGQYLPGVSEYFKQIVSHYLAYGLYNHTKFVHMVAVKLAAFPDTKHTLLIDRHPGGGILAGYFHSRGLIIRQSWNIKNYINIIVKPFYYILTALYYQVILAKVKTNINSIRPSVWIEYSASETDKNFFTFWVNYVKPITYDLVYYMDRSDSPISEQAIATCNKKGFKLIDMQKLCSAGKLTFTDYMFLAKEFFSINFRWPVWVHFFKLSSSVLFKLYVSVFKRYRVKILIQHQAVLWHQEVQAKAIEISGGIMLGFDWSHVKHIELNIITYPFHIFFAPGKEKSDWLKNLFSGFSGKYILPSGTWQTPNIWIGPNVFESQLAMDVVEGKKFLISIFDSSVGYNIHLPPESLSKFILKIIALMETNKSWGGIFKGKRGGLNSLSTLPSGDEIVARLEMLIQQKRFVILDQSVIPILASEKSNLSVCYGISSPGIFAAVNGHRAVHWDCTGWLKYPIYKDKEQKIIYSSLDELEKAIIKASKGDKSIGDFSKWKKDFNHFEDLKAPERVGAFIQDFMEEVVKSENGEQSLDLAVKKYIEKNRVGDDFFNGPDWWGSEEMSNCET